MSDLRAGVGRSDITPPVGILHGNWGAQTHSRATGVHLPLMATALVVSDGETGVVIVDLDLGVVPVDDAKMMRTRVSEITGYSPENVRISYTHTHSGPVWEAPIEDESGKPGEELVNGYRTTVVDQVAGAVHAALGNMKSCRMAAAYGECDIAVNRRYRAPDGRVVVSQHTDGFTDPTVLAVRLDDLDENPIVSLVGYGAHPIILAFQNSLISPDYPGVTKRVVEQLTGAPALFLQGCAGNQMTVEALTGDTAVADKMGSILGAEASRVLMGLRTKKVTLRWAGVVESGAPLGMWDEHFEADGPLDLSVSTKTLRLPVRDLPDGESARAAADELVAKAAQLARDDGSSPSERADANFQAKRAKMRARWAEWSQGRGYLETELHGTRIGPLGLVGFPGEPFAEIGSAIRAASPFPFTQFAGYSNGWLGYVPTPQEFSDGGYEVEWGSAYTDEAAPLLESGALELLAELAGS